MRTQFDNVVYHKTLGKFSISFATYGGVPGSEYIINTFESLPLFDDEDAAYCAGSQALDILEVTGKMP
jgi:hypothetical protein